LQSRAAADKHLGDDLSDHQYREHSVVNLGDEAVATSSDPPLTGAADQLPSIRRPGLAGEQLDGGLDPRAGLGIPTGATGALHAATA
jgi:hypothetical protein